VRLGDRLDCLSGEQAVVPTVCTKLGTRIYAEVAANGCALQPTHNPIAIAFINAV